MKLRGWWCYTFGHWDWGGVPCTSLDCFAMNIVGDGFSFVLLRDGICVTRRQCGDVSYSNLFNSHVIPVSSSFSRTGRFSLSAPWQAALRNTCAAVSSSPHFPSAVVLTSWSLFPPLWRRLRGVFGKTLRAPPTSPAALHLFPRRLHNLLYWDKTRWKIPTRWRVQEFFAISQHFHVNIVAFSIGSCLHKWDKCLLNTLSVFGCWLFNRCLDIVKLLISIEYNNIGLLFIFPISFANILKVCHLFLFNVIPNFYGLPNKQPEK